VELVKSHLLKGEGIEVHNLYLEMLAEYGLPGFLLFLAILVSTTSGLRMIARRRTTAAAMALPAMFAAFASCAFFLSVVNNKLLWMLVGIAAAARSRQTTPELMRMESS
jgi:O-antigen ligase